MLRRGADFAGDVLRHALRAVAEEVEGVRLALRIRIDDSHITINFRTLQHGEGNARDTETQRVRRPTAEQLRLTWSVRIWAVLAHLQ